MSEEDKQNEHDEQLMRDHWLSDLVHLVNSDDNVSFEFQVVTSSNNTDLSLVEKNQGFYVTDIELRRITSSNTASKKISIFSY